MTVEIRQSYLVCATPRSGSTLLCEMLRGTGCAGRPREHFEILRHSGLPRQPREYFDDFEDLEVIERLAPIKSATPPLADPIAWREQIRAEGVTGNGVWGGKLMWGHVEDLLVRARGLPGLADADLERALAALVGPPLLVFVTRADKVAQAVSLWRALQTQTWRAGHPGEDPSGAVDAAEYNFAAIDHLLARLSDDEDSWRAWFSRAGHRPLEVTYAELDRDPREPVGRVLRALGCEVPLPPPALSRQRDALSAAWVQRYLREREPVA